MTSLWQHFFALNKADLSKQAAPGNGSGSEGILDRLDSSKYLQLLGFMNRRDACQLMFFPLLLLWGPTLLLAQTSESPNQAQLSHQPNICHAGYPGSADAWTTECFSAPPGYGFYSVTVPRGPWRPVRAVRIDRGTCCPLPAKDIFLQEAPLVSTYDVCPDGYVVRQIADDMKKNCTRIGPLGFCRGEQGEMLQCAKVNAARYQLGAEQRGVFWGLTSKAWHADQRIRHYEIPAAIRSGVGRVSKLQRRSGGCIAEIPGALFVGKRGKYCRNLVFRRLEFIGVGEDPPRGTPVPMFPQCEWIDDPLTREPHCYSKRSLTDRRVAHD